MKQVLIRQGRVVVEEMPVPIPGPGEVLVRTDFSLISKFFAQDRMLCNREIAQSITNGQLFFVSGKNGFSLRSMVDMVPERFRSRYYGRNAFQNGLLEIA